MRRHKGFIAAGFGLAVLAVTGMRGRLRRYAIAENSMSPALSAGDWTLARKTRGLPHRGTVVVFAHPDKPEMELVKRVVGLPGEVVAIANGQVHIDGFDPCRAMGGRTNAARRRVDARREPRLRTR